MKKYKDRHLTKIKRAINVAYLWHAIFYGYATYQLNMERISLNNQLINNQITHDEFLQMGITANQKQEEVFALIALGVGLNILSDIVFSIATKNKDL